MEHDLELSVNNLKKCYEYHQVLCQKNKDLTKISDELKVDLSLSNNTVEHYKQLLNTLNETESVSKLYNSFRIKSSEINDNDELKQRQLLLEECFAQEKQTLIKDYEDRIASLTPKYVQENDALINELYEKITCYESEVADLKSTLEKKENQIQICQASADLQLDEAEMKWNTLVEHANEKLKESNNTCANLRKQIFILRSSEALCKEEIKKYVQENKELKEKLLDTENQLITAQEQLLQNQHSTIKKYTGSKQRHNNPRNLTYKVKKNMAQISDEHIDQTSNSNNSKAPTASVTHEDLHPSQGKNMSYENLEAVQGLYKTKHNVSMPPLQPCSESKGNTRSRKRKLFNPDNLDYLKELENQD